MNVLSTMRPTAEPGRAHDTSARHAIATAFFAHLSASGTSYVALGDVSADVSAPRGDLDVAVARDDLPRIPGLLFRLCVERKLRLVQMLEHEHTAAYFVLARGTRSPAPLFVAVDFCSDFHRRGRLLLRANELLRPRPETLRLPGIEQEISIPPAATAFIYYLLKKIDKGELGARHRAYLTDRWREDPEGATEYVRRFWTGADAETLRVAADGGDWAGVVARLGELRAALHVRAHRSVSGTLREGRRWFRRVRRPTGMSVCCLGSDGAGKTTVLRRMERRLAPAFRRTKNFHLRPRFGAESTGAAPVRNPHGEPPRGRVASVLKLAYWLVDFTVGHALAVVPSLIGSTLVLFDRHYVDLVVDPLRYRYGGPVWLARCVGRLVPRPHVTILLDAPPRQARARKPEVPIDELARQRDVYRELVREEGGVVVNAGVPLSDVLGQVNGVVLDRMAARTERRLRENALLSTEDAG